MTPTPVPAPMARTPAVYGPVPPPPLAAPRPPGPAASPGLLVRALVVGAVAAALVPGHRLGAGVVVAAAVLAVAVPARQGVRTAAGSALALSAAGLVAVAALRDAGWVVSTCLLAALACWSLLLSGEKTWLAALLGLVALPVRVLPALSWVARPLASLGERRDAGPAVRGAAVAVLLLAVFGGLFVSADAAFRDLLGRLALPAAGPLLPGRVVVGLLAAGLVGAAALVLAAPVVGSPAAPYAGRVLRPVEWVLPLVVLDALFAVFVGVQVAVLFGGRSHVLETVDLTYAQYARQGFAQLVVAAVLTLAVVAVASRVVPGRQRLLRALLAVLCLLTLVVLASASRRLGLYEQEYGFTRLRLSVDGAIAWLGVVLVLVLAAGTRLGAAWLPRAVVLSAALGLLVFAVADPDARIATRNVERLVATGDVDAAYLAGLSADAVPALQALPEPWRSCVLRGPGPDPLGGWNASRSRARASLLLAPPEPCTGLPAPR